MSRVFTSQTKNKEWLYAMIPIHIPKLESLFDSKRDADKARVFLHHLFHIRRRKKRNPKFHPAVSVESRWCPVQSETIKSLTHDYKRIVSTLLDNGIIEVLLNNQDNPSYSEGGLPMCYKVVFPEKFLLKGVVKYRRERITTKGVISSVRLHYENRYEHHTKKLINRVPWIGPCIDFLNQFYIDLPEYPFTTIEGFTEEAETKADDFNKGVGRFLTKDYYGGRIYSQLTSLPKVLRPYLRLRDSEDPLILVDVKSAQPYLLSAFFRFPNRLMPLIPEFTSLLPKVLEYSDNSSTGLFYEDCASGKFYQRLIDLSNLEKNDLKDLLFGHVFYASLYKYQDKPEIGRERLQTQRLFSSVYAAPLKVLKSLKHTERWEIPDVNVFHKDDWGEYNMYNTPNVIAARLEVSILIDQITRLCSKQGIQTATIHDAWIMRKSNLDEFRKVYDGVFESLGIRAPQLDIDYLDAAT